MLIALLIAGLTTAVVAPVILSISDDDDAADDDQEVSSTALDALIEADPDAVDVNAVDMGDDWTANAPDAGAAGSPGTDVGTSGDVSGEAGIDAEIEAILGNTAETLAEGGTAYDLPAGGANLILDTFLPGTDSLQISVFSTEATFTEVALDDGGVGLDVIDGDTASQIDFPNLGALPTDDISVAFSDESGEPPADILPLEDFLAAPTVLEPGTGDEPTIPTGDLASDVIDPLAPSPSLPTEETVAEPLEPVLDPVLDPLLDPEFPLDPVDGSTTAETTDPSVIYAGATGSEPQIADIANFDPSEGPLQIIYYRTDPLEEPFLEVSPSWDGADGIVTIDGEVTAILRGVPEATNDDVALDIQTILSAVQL
ncbi:MAG: hypothetical protein HKN63_06180 [Rhodobacteraceae bacterium]|nr:hypothetical protein [Paracoccaceae bacterium]